MVRFDPALVDAVALAVQNAILRTSGMREIASLERASDEGLRLVREYAQSALAVAAPAIEKRRDDWWERIVDESVASHVENASRLRAFLGSEVEARARELASTYCLEIKLSARLQDELDAVEGD